MPLLGVQEPVTAAVWYALNHYCYDNAIFIAERLQAEVHSMASVFLLGTCYYRSGRVQEAKYLLKGKSDDFLKHTPCTILYAQCCLDLEDFIEGVLALNGLLNLGENMETDLRARFGDDVGVALFLLGKLKLKLQHTADAAKCFRAALQFNPFLWSAFSALCEMEEEGVCPEDCFKVTEYPRFLVSQTSASQVLSNPILCPRTESDVITVAPDSPMAFKCSDHPYTGLSSLGSGTSAFKPVRKGPLFVTPDIFPDSAVGGAVASSTPAPPRQHPRREILPLVWDSTGPSEGPRGREGGGGGILGAGFRSLSKVKGALDFGSTGGKGGPCLKTSVGPVTPLNPSFGVLSLGTGGVESEAKGVEKVLNLVTPSPTPLSQDYLKILQSVPKSLRILPPRTGRAENVRSVRKGLASSLAASPLTFDAEQEGVAFRLGARSSSGSCRVDSPHPRPLARTLAATPDHRTPLKPGIKGGVARGGSPGKGSASLRRSSRLSGGGGETSATNKRLSEHAIHSVKGKPRRKSPLRAAIGGRSNKKGNRFSEARGTATPTFNSPKPSSPIVGVSSVTASLGKSRSKLGPLSPVLEDQAKEGTENKLRGELMTGSVGSTEEETRMLEKIAMSGLTSFMQLLRHLGQAHQALMKYDLGRAKTVFKTLPVHHLETPWVQGQMARAFFCAEKFKESAKFYKKVHSMDPHRQEGMEFYSSALWHLRQEVELSVLAHHLVSSNKLSPQALCARASLKNLYKEHEAAIAHLNQAITVCPTFGYAHTLLGHEYMLRKDYDKAMLSFQKAMTVQPRLYNAWYGMAHVCFAQEKYLEAEVYAKRSLSVNGYSSTACTQIGLAEFRRGKHDQALASFETAISINPSNPIAYFHKAKALEAKGLLEESLEELKRLEKRWPKEPSIYVSKGKILKRLDRTHEAALELSWALDLSSRGQNSQLREEIDQTYHNQNSRDESDGDFVVFSDSREGEGFEGAELQDESERSF